MTADEAGVGRGLVNTDKNNFAPRLGAAFRITDKSVIRGGYGIVYPTSAAQGMRDAIATNTFNQTVRTNQRVGLPAVLTRQGGNFGRGLTPFNNAVLRQFRGIAANAIPFDLQAPRIEQFNATFERELMNDLGIRVSYIGARQHGLIAGLTLMSWRRAIRLLLLPMGMANHVTTRTIRPTLALKAVQQTFLPRAVLARGERYDSPLWEGRGRRCCLRPPRLRLRPARRRPRRIGRSARRGGLRRDTVRRGAARARRRRPGGPHHPRERPERPSGRR